MFKESQKISSFNYYFPLIYFFSSILIEMGTFLALGFGILPKYFLFDISIIIAIFGFLMLFNNKIWQLCFAFVLLTVQSILSYTNVTLYNIYGDLFSFDMIALGVEAFKSFDPSFINYGYLFYIISILACALTLMIINTKKKYKINCSSKMTMFFAGFFLFSQILGCSTYATQYAWLSDQTESKYDYYFNNDKNMYNNFFIKSESLKNFGTFGFYTKNISNILNKKSFSQEEYVETSNFVKNGVFNKNNAKTGLLQDDNLIVIMCESLEWYGIDEILTPNLYKLFYSDGYSLTNYISKSKTNYSEMDSILGCVPSNNSFSNGFRSVTSDLLKNDLPFTLPNKFKAEGYDSISFFHDNVGNFYAREQTHPVFGFDNVITLDKMDFSEVGGMDKSALFQRDSDMFKCCLNQIAPVDKKFFSFITTITMHGPYKKNHLLQDNYNVLNQDGVYDGYLSRLSEKSGFVVPKSKKYKNLLKNYVATAMDLDKAISILLNHLENNNMLNNTTLVLYADHNAYFHDMSYELRGADKSIHYDPQLYRVPATIYSGKLGHGEVSDFTCPYNLLPTIFNLFGIKYNLNLYMAPSIFSEEFQNNIFVSQIGGIMTSNMYSDDAKVVYLLNDSLNDEDVYWFKKNALNFYDKQNSMNKVYNTNIFKYDKNLINYI